MTLIERIEAATGPSLVLDRDIAMAIYPLAKALQGNDARISVWDGNGWTQITVKPYTASLDAAVTLVPEGWCWGLSALSLNQKAYAHLYRAEFHGEHRGEAVTPAMALSVAALRARGEIL